MEILRNAIKEAKVGVGKSHFFDTILNALIIFLVSFFLLSLFNIPAILAGSIALAYFIVDSAKRIAINKIRIVEAHYPKLNERLRTASEYLKVENPVVYELHQEVLSEMKLVQEAEFVDEGKTFSKAGIVALMCFLILLFAPVSISLDFARPIVEKAKEAASANITFTPGGEEDATAVFGSGGKKQGIKIDSENDIYGKDRIARLGDEEVQLIIKPAGDSVNVRSAKEVEEKEFSESYPKEVFAVSASAYEEKIPTEQQEMVKKYFAAIAQG